MYSIQGAHCNIIVTQPRKISAVSIAEHIANFRGEPTGQSCGYSVRFESDLPRSHGSILLCTVGVLLRKLKSGLRGISHLIVDEIHERDLNTDFLLVVLSDLVTKFPEIRVVLMSATIDTKLFSEYFDNAPVINVQGRTFPVEQYFLEDIQEKISITPRTSKKSEGLQLVEENLFIEFETPPRNPNIEAVSHEIVRKLLRHIKSLNTDGAVLIFLPGWESIGTVFLIHMYCIFFQR